MTRLSLGSMGAALMLNLALLWLYYWPTPKRLIGDENYYFQLGVASANGQPVQHNLLWPPLYGDGLGALFSLFGSHPLAVQLPQIALWLLSAALLFAIAYRLSYSQTVAYGAAGLYLLSPELSAFSHYLWPETLHLFFFLAALWLLICHGTRWLAVAAAGVLLGLALLTKLLLGPFLPLLMVFMALYTAGSRPVRYARALLLGLTLTATLLPTLLNNLEKQGIFATADSSTFNLWLGLNDSERQDFINDKAGREFNAFMAAAPTLAERNRIYQDKIHAKLAEQGLWATLNAQFSKQYFRLLDHETFFTTQLPGSGRAAYHADAPVLIGLLHGWSHLYHAVLLTLAALGFCLWRPRRDWLTLLGLFVAYNMALFLLVHVKTRFLLQLVPILLIFAGLALAQCRVGWAESRGRLLAGVLLALGLNYLAFASTLE